MSTETIFRERSDVEKAPGMIHIAFEGDEKALCGWVIKEWLRDFADASEDCVVCAEMARQMGLV